MGRGKAEQPRHLAFKLKQIRAKLGYSQAEMANELEKQGIKVYRGYVGFYETEGRTPTLLIILAYAKIGKISTDYLIDDNLKLPD